MKITLAFLLFITALVRADVSFEIAQFKPDNPPAEVELAQEERDVENLILKGDASAVAGDRENALSLWSEAYSQKGAGEKQKRGAIERLQWACAGKGTGWEPEQPGQAFALFRRDSFLGANEGHRKQFIREFCDDTEHNQPHPEFDAYAWWLIRMLWDDKNFELLPLIFEDDLARNHLWLEHVISRISDYDFLLDPDRALQVVNLLGGGKASDSFNAKILDEVGETFMSAIIDQLTFVQEDEPDKYKRTRAALKKFLSSLKVTTLDSDLMLTLLQWDDDKALAKFLTKHGSKLAAMEPESKKTLLKMLGRM